MCLLVTLNRKDALKNLQSVFISQRRKPLAKSSRTRK